MLLSILTTELWSCLSAGAVRRGGSTETVRSESVWRRVGRVPFPIFLAVHVLLARFLVKTLG